MADPRPVDETQIPQLEPSPMLRFDGIRLTTLAVLAVNTIAVIALAWFLITSAQDQRETNECYQRQLDALTVWAATAVEASSASRQAQRELLLAQAGGIADGREAIRSYLAELDEADRTRSTAPVPAQRCTQ